MRITIIRKRGGKPRKRTQWGLVKPKTSIKTLIRYIYTMEYYSAIRRDEILPFVTTWMDLKIIMLSKISQTKKVENHIISLICGI